VKQTAGRVHDRPHAASAHRGAVFMGETRQRTVTGILTLLGLLTIAALLRQLRRVETGERALRESEERYALAIEGANEGHWDWDMVTIEYSSLPK
jgi:PAS domain-containing protein